MATQTKKGQQLIQRVDTVVTVNGKVLKLPADTPDGFPHIITVGKLHSWFVEGLPPPKAFSAVDAIATTLNKWKPKALISLLDMSTQHFSWVRVSMGYDIYIIRDGKNVKVGSVERGANIPPDFEVKFTISKAGKWRFTTQSHFGQNYPVVEAEPEGNYDIFFATYLITNKCWERGNHIEFYYKDDQTEEHEKGGMDDKEVSEANKKSENPEVEKDIAEATEVSKNKG